MTICPASHNAFGCPTTTGLYRWSYCRSSAYEQRQAGGETIAYDGDGSILAYIPEYSDHPRSPIVAPFHAQLIHEQDSADTIQYPSVVITDPDGMDHTWVDTDSYTKYHQDEPTLRVTMSTALVLYEDIQPQARKRKRDDEFEADRECCKERWGKGGLQLYGGYNGFTR